MNSRNMIYLPFLSSCHRLWKSSLLNNTVVLCVEVTTAVSRVRSLKWFCCSPNTLKFTQMYKCVFHGLCQRKNSGSFLNRVSNVYLCYCRKWTINPTSMKQPLKGIDRGSCAFRGSFPVDDFYSLWSMWIL